MPLVQPLVRFARVLRAAGLPVGTDRLMAACRALECTGVEQREDVYWTLAAVFLSRREQFEVFDQAFRGFWEAREPAPGPLPSGLQPDRPGDSPLSSRVLEALAAERSDPPAVQRELIDTEVLRVRASEAERLRRADFGGMSAAEMEAARRLMARASLPIEEVRTRRRKRAPRGPLVDLRSTLRATLRGGGDAIPLLRATWRRRHPPLTVLCDISGSMERYARMLLYFLHALGNDRDRMHVFLFGTRLTHVTRQLRHRDVDVALRAVAARVADWSGGTRIAGSLTEFNRRWSRRVLGQNAVVLLITDGLERDAAPDLDAEAERLRKSCRRLLWLNPLLRFDGFEPKAAGIRALLPHVDAFLPAHNLDSLEQLAQALSGPVRAVHPTRKPNAWR